MPIRMVKSETVVIFATNGCFGSRNEINSLEHVQVVLTIENSKRGSLEVYLKSPSGMFMSSFFILVYILNDLL